MIDREADGSDSLEVGFQGNFFPFAQSSQLGPGFHASSLNRWWYRVGSWKLHT